jgi:hypothetical protein
MTRSAINKLFALALVFLAGMFASRGNGKPVYTKDDFKIDFSGYVQEQALDAPMFYGSSFDLSQARFRPVLDFNFGHGLSAEFSQTLLLSSGSAISNPAYLIARKYPQPTYFKWDYYFVDTTDLNLDWSVYRGWVAYESKKFKAVVGRQRIAYGSAMFYSPLDIFNPISPLSLEPEERVGVDGASMEFELGQSSYASLAYGIGDSWDETRLAAYYKTTVKSFDLHFLAARIFTEYTVGAAFSGYVRDGSLYGEFSYTIPDHGLNYVRGTIGYEYNFKNGILMIAEYYHNDGVLSLSDMNNAELMFSTQRGLATIDHNFLCLSAGFDLNPLLRFNSAIIYDMDAGSFYIGPSFSYSAPRSITIAAGAQLFGGNPGGDFGLLPPFLWGRVRWDF